MTPTLRSGGHTFVIFIDMELFYLKCINTGIGMGPKSQSMLNLFDHNTTYFTCPACLDTCILKCLKTKSQKSRY